MAKKETVELSYIINTGQLNSEVDKAKKIISGVHETAETSTKRTQQMIKTIYDQSGQAVSGFGVTVDNVTKKINTQTQAFEKQSSSNKELNKSLSSTIGSFKDFGTSTKAGLDAVTNSLPALAEQLINIRTENQRLSAEGKKGTPVWKQLVKGLGSWNVLLSIGTTLIATYGEQVVKYFSTLINGKKAIDEARDSQEALNSAFESDKYKAAIKDVQQLKSNLALAKEEKLDAKHVIDQYNNSVGTLTQSVQTLDEVEKGIIKNGDQYIQGVHNKVAAETKLNEAVEEQAKINQTRKDLENKLKKAQDTQQKNRKEGKRSRADGSLSTSISKYKKELNELENKQKEVNASIEAYKELLNDAYDQKIPNKKNKTKNESSDEVDYQIILSQRESLWANLLAIDKEYANQRLTVDEQEKQALKDKLSDMKKAIEDYNKTARPKDQITDQQFQKVADNATKNLDEVHAQRKLEASRKIYEEAREQHEREIEAEREKYKAILDELKTHQEKVLAIEESYEEKKKLLRDNHEGADLEQRINLLEQSKQEEIKVVQKSTFEQSQAYQTMNEGIAEMSRKQIKARIQELKKLKNEGYKVDDGSSDGTKVKLNEDQEKNIDKAISNAEKGLGNKTAQDAQGVADAFNQIGGALHELSASFEGVNDGLADTLGTMGDLADIGGSAASAVASFAAGDIAGGIAGTIQTVAKVVSLNKEVQESKKRAAEEILKLQQQEEDGIRRINELERQRRLEDAKNIELKGKSLKAQRDALKQNEAQRKKDEQDLMSELQGGSFVSGEHTERYGGFLGIARKTKVVKEYSSLAGKSFEDIEKLYEQGDLEGRTAELFEQLRDLKEEGRDVAEEMREIEKAFDEMVTGTSSDTIASGIIDGLRQGREEVKDFAEDMESVLTEALLASMQVQMLEAPINELFKSFADDVESGDELTKGEADKFRKEYEKIVEDALEVYKQAQDVISIDENGEQDVTQTLEQLKEKWQEITGTSSDSISNGIIEGLKNGYTALEDFAGNMETLLQTAILNSIKTQYLQAPVKELMKSFAEDVESGNELTESEAEEFRDQYEEIVQGAMQLYDEASKVVDTDSLSQNGPRGLKGAIKRELTEDTASELTGLYRATFDLQKRSSLLDEKWFQVEQTHLNATRQIVASNAAIQKNTADALIHLQNIANNTKQKSNGYDRGF